MKIRIIDEETGGLLKQTEVSKLLLLNSKNVLISIEETCSVQKE
jgi:hypothetical protein